MVENGQKWSEILFCLIKLDLGLISRANLTALKDGESNASIKPYPKYSFLKDD
jgi:hypothetical protein